MARIRPVQDALGHPPDDAAQQPHFLQVLGIPAVAPLDLARELFVHEVLNYVQIRVVPRKDKVASVHKAPDIEPGVVEAARARLSSRKPEAPRSRGAQ
eukprot:9480198-Alexandrium_andersonii.AAC.1